MFLLLKRVLHSRRRVLKNACAEAIANRRPVPAAALSGPDGNLGKNRYFYGCGSRSCGRPASVN